jgi:hypothetical protein
MPGYKQIEPRFKKGESGNPKGRPKLPDLKLLLADILGEEKDGKTAAEAILMKLRQMAAQGNLKAAEMLLNRGYGLPKQTVELSGNPDAPINFVLDERYKDDPGIST